jgi:enoyl-[acyl-carrier-protein] reductase (NADH)
VSLKDTKIIATKRALYQQAVTYQKRVAFTRRKDVLTCKRLTAEVEHLKQDAQAELAPRGIRINVVAPGFIQTPGWERVPAPADVMTALTKRLLGSVPLDGWGQAEEVAKVVLFLASDDSSHVHGSEIIVDGGLTGTMFWGPNYRG